MLRDDSAQPLPGRTYGGFSGPQPHLAAATRKRFPHTLIGGGLIAAVAMGLTFALWARPQLGQSDAPAAPMSPSPATDSKMSVEVTAPGPLPTPASAADGRLEVLPPDMERAAARTPITQAMPPPPPPLPEPVATTATPPPAVAAIQPRRAAGPGFDCADAQGLAEEMVCQDPGLAQAERRMARAYRRALASGAPPESLRAEQQDWLAAREEAARQSPNALAQAYRERIEDLESVAEDGPR